MHQRKKGQDKNHVWLWLCLSNRAELCGRGRGKRALSLRTNELLFTFSLCLSLVFFLLHFPQKGGKKSFFSPLSLERLSKKFEVCWVFFALFVHILFGRLVFVSLLLLFALILVVGLSSSCVLVRKGATFGGRFFGREGKKRRPSRGKRRFCARFWTKKSPFDFPKMLSPVFAEDAFVVLDDVVDDFSTRKTLARRLFLLSLGPSLLLSSPSSSGPALVPDLEEAVPRSRADGHAVLRDAQAADAVVVAGQDACKKRKKNIGAEVTLKRAEENAC